MCGVGDRPVRFVGAQACRSLSRLLLIAYIFFVKWETGWPAESAAVEEGLHILGDRGRREEPFSTNGHISMIVCFFRQLR